ncbi:MAG: carbohydrate kinase [Gammaproteobacteria bacterium]|nr:carbohydrate kinase [Gammaproteobacteria bacterium]
MNDNNFSVPVIFGEVLFDCFPDGNLVLGGAPFNVAWHLQAFALSPLMISAVGDDALGKKVKSAMLDWNMSIMGLQLDTQHPTGSVDIKFDEDGEPQYSIVEHRAYDYISDALLPLLPESSLLYHGSLALRNQTSRQALSKLKAEHTGSVFMDVNLRDPWWQKEFVLNLVDDADWVKLNEDELNQLARGAGDIESQSREFIDRHKLEGLIITLGAKGAIAFTDNAGSAQVEPSQTLEVVDTVGAGDAFTSVLILGLTHQWPLDQTMQRAQEFASLMVGQQGATVHEQNLYQEKIVDWDL